MRRVGFLYFVILLLAGSAARAEDFSGFYAGVNAGSAFDRNREARKAGSAPAPSDAAATGDDLPPSAAGATKALRQERPAGGGKGR